MRISKSVMQIRANYVPNIGIEIYLKILFYTMGGGGWINVSSAFPTCIFVIVAKPMGICKRQKRSCKYTLKNGTKKFEIFNVRAGLGKRTSGNSDKPIRMAGNNYCVNKHSRRPRSDDLCGFRVYTCVHKLHKHAYVSDC